MKKFFLNYEVYTIKKSLFWRLCFFSKKISALFLIKFLLTISILKSIKIWNKKIFEKKFNKTSISKI